MLLLLRVALTKQVGSAVPALYTKIGDGRLCMQWPHAIDNTVRVIQRGSAHCIKIGDGRLCMQWPRGIVGAEPTGQITHNSSTINAKKTNNSSVWYRILSTPSGRLFQTIWSNCSVSCATRRQARHRAGIGAL